MFRNLNYLVLFSMMLLWGCVGTVEDAKLKLNDLFVEETTKLNFLGIEEARPVAHDKVEIEFTPIASSDPNNKYILYINGNSAGIEINPDSLNDGLAGRKLYLVDGLLTNTSYKFLLRVKNTVKGSESKNEQEKTARTFDNRTANFRGVTSLKKITGQASSKIRIDWVPAQMEGILEVGHYDPVYYEVTIIGEGGPQNLNNPNYTGFDRQTIKVPSPPTLITPDNHSEYTFTEIDSLSPDTQYYVQVRAVNKVWHTFASDPENSYIPVNREVNTKFMRIKTSPVDANFEFNRESLQVINAPGLDALTKVNAYWNPGVGTFIGYRLYYKKFSQANPTRAVVESTDELNSTQMIGLQNESIPQSDDNGRILSVSSDKTSFILSMLSSYRWYQFKIVLCKTAACPVDPLDANYGRVSELRFIRTEPKLAPFSGITKLSSPKNTADLDVVTVSYEPPSLNSGYADELEVFCIDPTTYNPDTPASIQFVQLGTTPAVTPISNCSGLKLDSFPSLTGTSIKIRGVKSMPKYTSAQANYCFAMSPAIRQQAEELPPAGSPAKGSWIVRCINPEIITPSIADFPGAQGTCGVSKNSITVNWTVPKAGLYTDYKIFWRKLEGSQTFRFSEAVAANPAYSSANVAASSGNLTYKIDNLRPGTRYRVGVLTSILYDGNLLYSEHNVNIRDCVTEMPTAEFDEWTRIFAIGPKIDGRFPLGVSSGKRFFQDSAKIYEAINVDGIPYEVDLDAAGNPIPNSIQRPPGTYSTEPLTFSDAFDGATSKVGALDYAMSRNGIVSIAWKDVKLSFLESEFKECQFVTGQPAPSRSECSGEKTKTTRRYGYKVFRSHDNRLSWVDITGPSSASGTSLVYAGNYKFYRREDEEATNPGIVEVSERMAFFTDYSVRAMVTDPEGIERARVYWYKIVPYFDNKPLVFNDSALVPANEIKVVLPPHNSALVHRMMANLKACSDIGRYSKIDKDPGGFYRCDYDGVGARAKGFPWQVEKTVIDQGGDLLVDRYEMGCQFTRGDFSPRPNLGSQSFFTRPVALNQNGFTNMLRTFTGVSTDDEGGDVAGSKFVGCTNGRKMSPNGWLVGQNKHDEDVEPSYKKFLYGDCMGSGTMSIPIGACSDNSRATRWQYIFPGAFPAPDPGFDCTNNSNPLLPQHAGTMFTPEFQKNINFQSEFAAVYYNRDPRSSATMIPWTTNGSGGHTPAIVWNETNEWRYRVKSCFINLAAIGTSQTDGYSNVWRARWFPVNDLNRVKDGAGRTSIINHTMGQVLSDPDLFSGTSGEYKAPTGDFVTSSRYDMNTQVGKIFSSNSAKLPALSGLPLSMAQGICQLHQLDVGFSTDASNFLSFGFPKPKRLMGRPEQISAATWPDSATNTSGYNYTNANITTLEIGKTPNSCVGAEKSSGEVGTGRDSIMTAAEISDWAIGKNAPLFSGSAKADVGSDPTFLKQSSRCISRYGIQDLVGNYSEVSPEVFFCDYSKDTMHFGQYTGSNPYTGDGFGLENDSVLIPVKSWENQDLIVFWADAKIDFKNSDGSLVRTVGGPTAPKRNIGYASIKPESGYCSLVDSTQEFSYDSTRFRDDDYNFINLFLSDGLTPNSAMIERAQPHDQSSVDRMRNGDGFYLSFGPDNIGPKFQDGNALAITNQGLTSAAPHVGQALGPYFNPLTGFPISCGQERCEESKDNMHVSTSFLSTRPAPQVPKIPDFPIGNSQVQSIGISDWSYYSSINLPFFTWSWDIMNPPDPNNVTRIVDYVEVINNNRNAPIYHFKTMTQFVAERGYGTYTFNRPQFALPRDSVLGFLYGGNYESTKSGRFTANQIIGTDSYYQVTSSQGFRCSVLINTD